MSGKVAVKITRVAEADELGNEVANPNINNIIFCQANRNLSINT